MTESKGDPCTPTASFHFLADSLVRAAALRDTLSRRGLWESQPPSISHGPSTNRLGIRFMSHASSRIEKKTLFRGVHRLTSGIG